MVNFASKAGKNIREDIKKSSGAGKYLRNIRDGKDCEVRFLQDPEDWFKYREHYGAATKFFPCTQDEACPGCTSDDEKLRKSSRRYVSNVIIVREKDAKDEGQVVLLKIPLALANRLTAKADRNGGTLLDRNYTLIRTGNGLDTDYDAEAEDKSPVNTAAFELLDPEPYLVDMFDSAWGTDTLEKINDRQDLSKAKAETPAVVPGVRDLIKNSTVGKDAPVEEDKPPF